MSLLPVGDVLQGYQGGFGQVEGEKGTLYPSAAGGLGGGFIRRLAPAVAIKAVNRVLTVCLLDTAALTSWAVFAFLWMLMGWVIRPIVTLGAKVWAGYGVSHVAPSLSRLCRSQAD